MLKELEGYENESVEEVIPLLEKDAITYSVLIAILKRPCTKTFTNHDNIIICYSSAPYPVWVWYDGNKKDELEEIAECLKTNFPIEEGYAYNIEGELFEDLQEVDEYFKDKKVKMNLLSYKLRRIRPFLKKCEGEISIPQLEDLELLASYWQDSVKEMEQFEFTYEQCLGMILKKIEDGTLYTWVDDREKIVALCECVNVGIYSKVTGVYTLPEERRKGYALNLVKEVTQKMLDEDLIPILYTDGSSEASNACYKKIGYKIEGRLCTVGK